jgi:hypothetical protein
MISTSPTEAHKPYSGGDPYMEHVNSYDMEVGENRVHVFYGTEKREGERLEIYTGGIGPCGSTVYQTCNMSPAHVHQ